ncbi:golgin subfamily A member 6-like protein 22 [Tachysurus ichikawai]
MSLHEKWMRPQLAFPKAKQEAVSPQQQKKKKPLKVRLNETQEELRIEKEAREELDKENTKLKEERNFFIKELDKMEQLRCSEMKLYKALHHEEVYKMKMETENLRATLKMEEQEKFKRLEQAMDLEREQWRQEREKLLIDKENVRMQHDDMEKQKLEIEATWKEHNDCWMKKTSTMLDMIEDKSEMIDKLKRMVEVLQKEAEMKKHGIMDELKMPSKNKQNNFFTRFFQKKKIREEEQVMEIESLVLHQKESRAKQDNMAYVMEAILKEMNEMKGSLAEKEGIELEYEKERKQFQAEKERFTIKLEKQTKNLEEERKRCNILVSSWREHSDQLEQKIMEKDRLLEKKNKETEVLKRTMEAQQIKNAQALKKEKEVLMEEKDKPKRRPVDEKEMEVTESTKPREEPEENMVMDIVLERKEDMEMVKGSREGHEGNNESGA